MNGKSLFYSRNNRDAEAQKKQNKFNAAVMSQVGILRLLEDQPFVALSYFERANKMDPEEPLY